MAIKEEIKKSSELRFDGRLIKVTFDVAEVNGKDAWREVVHHPGASAVIAIDDKGRIVMERQYRYALGRTLLEIPAGKLDGDEDPLVCAQRELAEESGDHAEEGPRLGTSAASPR
uniref:NUDIX domain-containing protein n=1 Tax=Veillonella magna TaxID=464322 RepID=UPI00402AB772